MRKGFTLIETVIALTVMVTVVAAAMGSWVLFLQKSNRANTQSMLDMDVRKVIERFRSEMRNAARDTVMFYPVNQPPYTAVAFALASDADGDGLMDMDEGGTNLLWQQTVVYHVYEHQPTQMRRTVFSNRKNDATYSERYGQMERVVADGDGEEACLAGEDAETSVMFENLFSGRLWHAESSFDGYAGQPNTRERLAFGSLPLGPGEHTFKFTVEGANPQAEGQRIRVDQVIAGASGWPLEAELRSASGVSSVPYFVGEGLAGAAYGLDAETLADDDAISLTVFNDAIEECAFVGEGRNVSFSNTVVRFDAALQPAGLNQGVYVARLDGSFAATWFASEQTATAARDGTFVPTNCAVRIPVFSPWVVADGYGPVFRLYKSNLNGGLKITNPSFAIVDAVAGSIVTEPDIPAGGSTPLFFFQNGAEKADWAAANSSAHVELRPRDTVRIPPGSTLMLSLEVEVASYGADALSAFTVARAGVPGCWVWPGAPPGATVRPTWSTDPQVETVAVLPALDAIAVGFADGGAYVSTPYDTKSDSGNAKTMSWDADVPSGCELILYARSGNTLSQDRFNIADAAAWADVVEAENGATVVDGGGRYVQFRAVYRSKPSSAFPGVSGATTSGPYRSETPRLHRVFLRWDGDLKYVDIAATMLKGPDCGRFLVEIDGQPLIRGVTMEIEIFKDIRMMGGLRKERLRSAMMAEIEPRNSGK
jgi:prepilin-type N-terminal cleavage/methylation domain-containing protein